MKLIFSLLVLAAPVALYWFVIRPRLRARFTDLYTHIDSFWGRIAARLYAFRTYAIGGFGLFLSEAPSLLDQLQFIDLSFLPAAWQSTMRAVTIIGMLATRAFATTPREEKPL